ncbi:MAG: dihydropyrimidinase [Planctomycetota bacterium]|jgi:dihydropyrimidinase
MPCEKVIRGGVIYNGGETIRADIGIVGEKIAAVEEKVDGAEVIDASGKYVFPGGIDVHVHFQLPFGGTVSADDFKNGTKAAACGGVTTVMDFAMQVKGDSLVKAVEARKAEAEGKVCVDFSLHGSITDWNEGTASDMRELVDAGVPTFKMFMIYRDEGWMADDASLYQALELSKDLGAQIGVHAESAALLDLLMARLARDPERKRLGAVAHARARPGVVEWEAIQRALAWAEATGGRLYIVHTSTARGARLIDEARKRGVNAYCETCPQYLLLDESVFERKDGHRYATAPQIKTKEDARGLWEGLEEGFVHVIATDTCTFNAEQKALWKGDFRKIPLGLPGVENLIPLTFTYGPGEGRFSINHWVRLISENPAKIFGLYPQKGVIRAGGDADIVVWDPDRAFTITPDALQTNSDWSPYDGFTTKGYPHLTLSRGKVVAREGKFVGEVGHGRFLKRRPGGGLE